MMFLDTCVIVLNVYEYFMLFSIFILLLLYSLRFLRKKKFNFVFKIICFYIYFLHIGLDIRLDYDSINTIILFYQNISLLFSRFEL